MCPYCNGKVEFRKNSSFIYGRDYGPVYCCINYPSCDAYVGCHKGTKNPLGRLADEELRKYKKLAHMYFDKLWKTKMERGYRNRGGKSARSLGYKWLSSQMGKDINDTHIGMFSVEECKKVIQICRPYYNRLR